MRAGRLLIGSCNWESWCKRRMVNTFVITNKSFRKRKDKQKQFFNPAHICIPLFEAINSFHSPTALLSHVIYPALQYFIVWLTHLEKCGTKIKSHDQHKYTTIELIILWRYYILSIQVLIKFTSILRKWKEMAHLQFHKPTNHSRVLLQKVCACQAPH